MSAGEKLLLELIESARCQYGDLISRPVDIVEFELKIKNRLDLAYQLGIEASKRLCASEDKDLEISEGMAKEVLERHAHIVEITSKHNLAEGYRLGDAILQPILNHYIPIACQLAEKIGIGKVSPIVFGVLPIASPNARAIAVPNSSEYIVVFQTGLPSLLNRLTKIIVEIECACPLDLEDMVNFEKEGWTDKYKEIIYDVLDNNKWIDALFLSVMAAHLIYGLPQLAPPHYRNFLTSDMSSTLLYYCELFIVGHEVAHIARGHFSSSSARCAFSFGKNTLAAINASHMEELEADMLGVSMVWAEANEKCKADAYLQTAAYATPDLFFSIVKLIESYIDPQRNISQEPPWPGSHPPPEVRSDLFRQVLRKHKDKHTEVFATRLQIILDVLAERSFAEFQHMAQENDGLSWVWKQSET